MRSRTYRRLGLAGFITLAGLVVGESGWKVQQETRAQSNPEAGAAEPSVAEGVRAMKGSIASLKEQLQLLEAQLDALETRIAATTPNNWRPDPREFVAIYRAQSEGVHFLHSGASLAKFTLEGVDVDSLRPIDNEVHHVAVDSADGKVYGIGSHRIVEIDPQSMELKELPIPAALPELSWPCGMTFDSARRRIVVASLGGEGHLYALDTATRTWSLISSLQNVDLSGLAYSVQDDIYLGLEVTHEGAVHLHTFTPKGSRTATRDLSYVARPGELGQHDCQFAVVSGQGVIVASSHYNGALGRAIVHDPKLVVFDLADAPRGRRQRGGRGRGGEASATFQPLDFGTAANQAMDQTFQLPYMTGNDLREMPRGEQRLDGVTFQIRDACIHLAGALIPQKPSVSEPIPVRGRVARLHFLHATGWGEDVDDSSPGFVSDGTQVAKYVVRYSDGNEEEVPVIYGRDLRNWWKFHDGLPETVATVAWEGSNASSRGAGMPIRLYHSQWDNPHADLEIESIVFERVNPSIVAPFCVAITAEVESDTR